MVLKHTDFKKILESATIALGACSLVVLVAVITIKSQTPDKSMSGMGGLETPGLPIVSDEMIEGVAQDIDTPYTEHIELSYAAYRVKPGDMIGIIAQENGITEDTIISVNNIRSSRLLQIGTYLKIPSMPGILYTVRKNGESVESIAEKYKIDADKCATVNNLALEDSLTAGTTLFVPDAEMDWVTRQEINGDLFKKPIHARWYLTSRWGWRASPFTGARSYHSGVDMACPQGTNIFAAMDGKVTSTGYNATYGNYVIITHHSGYQTLYGHMSAILTVRGKHVSANTVIGKVGSTGLSTGPHLHFTIYKNGKTVNPQNLWN